MSEKKVLFSQPLSNENVVDRIVRQITDKIISGDLKPGDKLPTEADLCQAFQVGRNSVREAIKILCAYGVVYIKRADGTFINDKYPKNMLDPMLYGILLQSTFARDILLLRRVLDTGILHTVIHSVTPEQIHTLYTHLDRMRELAADPGLSMEQLFEADVEFHMTITSFTDNELLYSMYSYVDRITRPSREHALTLMIEEGKTADFVTLHEKIVSMIENKQFTEIEHVLTSHYQFWDQVV